jgi:hypothetical protein
VELNITEAWQKITGDESIEFGRAGWIPVYDGEWRVFRSTQIIWPGMEISSDPAKVDKLRQNALELLAAFPDTIPQLEKLGIRVKALLNHPIVNQADVITWAGSIFNQGPVLDHLPPHVADAVALGYDDFKIVVQSGRHPQYVLPAGPRDSKSKMTVNYNVPGSKLKFGPRHQFSKTAFSPQAPEAPQGRTGATKRYRGTLDENGATRPRGRPRKDGLTPGSKEAKAADKQKKRDLLKARTVREKTRAAKSVKAEPQIPEAESANGHATITELPTTRRILARVGGEPA